MVHLIAGIRRKLCFGVIGLAVMCGMVGTATVPVYASADGCTHPYDVGACIRVIGNGLYVETIQGGAYVGPRQSVRGHYEIYYGNVHKNAPGGNKVYWNENYIKNAAIYAQGPITINMNLGDGTEVCAYFWEYDGSNYSRHGPACVTIHK